MNYKKKDKWLYVIILFAVAIVIEAAILIMIWTRRHSGTGASAPAIEEKLRTGQKYLSEMDYDKAIAAFTEAIEVDEKSTEAYVGLGDAYAGKEDWTQAVINYDEAVRTVAYKLQSEPREEKEKETAISAGRNNAVAYGSDENNSVQKDADGKDTDDNNSVVMYVTEEEKTILAVLDGMTGSAVDSDIQAAPVEGTAITVIDGEYVRDVIESRNRALEAGLTEIRESENSDAEMGDWLSKAGHPDYAPQNEALSEEKNMLTIDEAAPGQEFSEDIDVNNNDPGYAPYIKVIDDLEREYGQIELVRSDYYKSDAEAWEVEGVCLFTLLDMDNTGAKELFAVCKKNDEEYYRGFVYTITEGTAQCVLQIDETTLFTNGGFFNIAIIHADDKDRIVCSPTKADMSTTILYGLFDGQYGSFEYKCKLSYTSDTSKDAYYINDEKVDNTTYTNSEQEQGLSNLYTSENNTILYVRVLNKEYLDYEKLISTTSKTKALILEESDSDKGSYIDIINNLSSKYGSLRIVQNNGEWQNEANGLCYLNLVDFTGDGEDELFAVCKNEEEEHYTGYIYTMGNGSSELLFESDQIEYNFFQGFDLVKLGYTSDTGYVFGTGWEDADADDMTFFWYKDGKFEPVYRYNGYWDSNLEDEVINEKAIIVDIFDDAHRDEFHNSSPGITLRTKSDIDVNGDYYDSHELRKSIDDVIRKLDKTSAESPSDLILSGTDTITDSDLDNNTWKEAYADYIRSDIEEIDSKYSTGESYENRADYYCIYVDNDSVPEIIIDYNVHAIEMKILSFYNGKVHAANLLTEMNYIENSGVIHTRYMQMGVFIDRIYELRDGEIILLGEGEGIPENQSSLENYTYTWDGEDVDEENYQIKIDSLIDSSQAVSLSDSKEKYSYKECLDFLK